MPFYIYCHPKNENKIVELLQGINDEHSFTDSKGVKWRRVYTVPQAVIDGKIDIFSESAFADKTHNAKGSLGDIWDRSAELSAKRADKAGGVDPIKEKFYKEYSKKRKGKPHPSMNADKTYTI